MLSCLRLSGHCNNYYYMREGRKKEASKGEGWGNETTKDTCIHENTCMQYIGYHIHTCTCTCTSSCMHYITYRYMYMLCCTLKGPGVKHEIDLSGLWLEAALQTRAGVDDDDCLHQRGREGRLWWRVRESLPTTAGFYGERWGDPGISPPLTSSPWSFAI